MRPVSGAMLLVAAVLSSPALAGAVMGSVPVDVALLRYLVAAAASWVLLTLAAELIGPDAPATAAAGAQDGTQPAEVTEDPSVEVPDVP